MKAKRCGKLACFVMGVTLLAGERASAGPYPMEQLCPWLQDAKVRLAAVQEAITALQLRVADANALLVKFATATRGSKVAGVETAAVVIEARRQLGDLRRQLAASYGKRQAILNEIEMIYIQMNAWCEMEEIDPRWAAWCEKGVDPCGE